MDGNYKAWQLAALLYYALKECGGLEAGATKENLMKSRVYGRIGTDDRTKEKYWNTMLTEKYLVDLGNGKFTVVKNIEELKPVSLGTLLNRARKTDKQKTLDEEYKQTEQALDEMAENYDKQVKEKQEAGA